MKDYDQTRIIKEYQNSYEKGFRCIYYETDESDRQFTVYLKNFDTENIKILKCNQEDGNRLKEYIKHLF